MMYLIKDLLRKRYKRVHFPERPLPFGQQRIAITSVERYLNWLIEQHGYGDIIPITFNNITKPLTYPGYRLTVFNEKYPPISDALIFKEHQLKTDCEEYITKAEQYIAVQFLNRHATESELRKKIAGSNVPDLLLFEGSEELPKPKVRFNFTIFQERKPGVKEPEKLEFRKHVFSLDSSSMGGYRFSGTPSFHVFRSGNRLGRFEFYRLKDQGGEAWEQEIMFWIGEYFALVNSKDFEPDDVEFARLKFEELVSAYEAHGSVPENGWYFHQED